MLFFFLDEENGIDLDALKIAEIADIEPLLGNLNRGEQIKFKKNLKAWQSGSVFIYTDMQQVCWIFFLLVIWLSTLFPISLG